MTLRAFNNNKAFLNDERVVNGEKVSNYFCINTKGEVLFELPKGVFATSFIEDVAIVRNLDNKYALVDNKGEFLCDFNYSHIIRDSEEGFFKVVNKEEKCGFIDLKRREVISCEYEDVKWFSEGIATVCLNKKWGAIDFNNNVVIPFIYNDLSACHNNLMSAKKEISKGEYKYGLVDKFNNIVCDFKFDEINCCATKNCICYPARIGDNWGFIDKYGNTVEEFKYYIYDLMSVDKNNLGERCFVMNDNKKWALYSTVETRFLTDFIFDGGKQGDEMLIYNNYSQNCFAFNKNGKFGFIDIDGNIIVKPIYDDVEDYNEGIATVELNGKQGAINLCGEVIIPIEYKKLFACSDGLISVVNKDDETGVIDKNNNIIIPFGKFSFCGCYSCGFAIAVTKDDEDVYVNKKGEILKINA